jgi:cytochrome c oxidase cbb3-type subunit 4
MEYETVRNFAGTFGLVYLFVVFLIAVLFVLRPGADKQAENAANIPFKEDR